MESPESQRFSNQNDAYWNSGLGNESSFFLDAELEHSVPSLFDHFNVQTTASESSQTVGMSPMSGKHMPFNSRQRPPPPPHTAYWAPAVQPPSGFDPYDKPRSPTLPYAYSPQPAIYPSIYRQLSTSPPPLSPFIRKHPPVGPYYYPPLAPPIPNTEHRNIIRTTTGATSGLVFAEKLPVQQEDEHHPKTWEFKDIIAEAMDEENLQIQKELTNLEARFNKKERLHKSVDSELEMDIGVNSSELDAIDESSVENSHPFSHTPDNSAELSGKKRRRPNKQPILEGNNRFGQRGTRKCKTCRKRHQKCVYNDIDDQCVYCQKHGLGCSVKEWGPKHQNDKVTAVSPTYDIDDVLRFEASNERGQANELSSSIYEETSKWSQVKSAIVQPLRSLSISGPSLYAVLGRIPSLLQQTWSSITDANKWLSEVDSVIDIVNQLAPSSIDSDKDNPEQNYLLESIEIFRKLNIYDAWKVVDQLWSKFFSKMSLFTGEAEEFKSSLTMFAAIPYM